MIRLEKSHENPVTHFPKLEVGQKVVIKSSDWYYIKKDYYGIVKLSTESFTVTWLNIAVKLQLLQKFK